MKRSKTEVYEAVLSGVKNVSTKFGLSSEVADALFSVIDTELKPKVGGSGFTARDISEVVKFENDKIVKILCQFSGEFLPANEDIFYADKKGQGVGGTGLRRASKIGEATVKRFNAFKTKKQNELTALLVRDASKASYVQAELKKLDDLKPDFSAVKDFATGKISIDEAKDIIGKLYSQKVADKIEANKDIDAKSIKGNAPKAKKLS